MKVSIILIAAISLAFVHNTIGKPILHYDRAHGEGKTRPQLHEIAQDVGLEIRESDQPIGKDSLADTKLLYLRAPRLGFLPAEQKAIIQFLKTGGSLLLVLDEEARQSLEKSGVNELIVPFGMMLTGDTPYLHNQGAIAPSGIINREDREIPYSGGRAIAGGIPFTFRLDENGDPELPMAAYNQIDGGGRIVVMGEGMASIYLGELGGVRLSGEPRNPKKTNYWGKDSKIFMREVIEWLIHDSETIGANQPFISDKLVKLWEISPTQGLRSPESIVYDPARNCLYVSNFNVQGGFIKKGDYSPDEFISKLSLSGEILDIKWLEGVASPLGMTLDSDAQVLYAVERERVLTIDTRGKKGKVLRSISLKGSKFPNDIAMDSKGRLYVSDAENQIWRSANPASDAVFELWYKGEEISLVNGLLVQGDELFAACDNDRGIVAINLETKATRTIARPRIGPLDGIRYDEEKCLYVSWFRGRLARIYPDNRIEEIIDTSAEGPGIADFECIPEKRILILPDSLGHSITAYRLL